MKLNDLYVDTNNCGDVVRLVFRMGETPFCRYLLTLALNTLGFPVPVLQPVCLANPTPFERQVAVPQAAPKKGVSYVTHEPSFEEWKGYEQCDPAAFASMEPDKFKRVREYDCDGNLLFITLYHGGTQLFSVTAGPDKETTDKAEEAVDDLLFKSWKVTTLTDEVEYPKECRKLRI